MDSRVRRRPRGGKLPSEGGGDAGGGGVIGGVKWRKEGVGGGDASAII